MVMWSILTGLNTHSISYSLLSLFKTHISTLFINLSCSYHITTKIDAPQRIHFNQGENHNRIDHIRNNKSHSTSDQFNSSYPSNWSEFWMSVNSSGGGHVV